MQTPIVLSNTHGLTFKKDLTQIEMYGIYFYIAEAFEHSDDICATDYADDYTIDAIERMFGFAPSQGTISCTNHVEWPGFEHHGPVDYFALSENHVLCAVYVYDDADTVYLRLN